MKIPSRNCVRAGRCQIRVVRREHRQSRSRRRQRRRRIVEAELAIRVLPPAVHAPRRARYRAARVRAAGGDGPKVEGPDHGHAKRAFRFGNPSNVATSVSRPGKPENGHRTRAMPRVSVMALTEGSPPRTKRDTVSDRGLATRQPRDECNAVDRRCAHGNRRVRRSTQHIHRRRGNERLSRHRGPRRSRRDGQRCTCRDWAEPPWALQRRASSERQRATRAPRRSARPVRPGDGVSGHLAIRGIGYQYSNLVGNHRIHARLLAVARRTDQRCRRSAEDEHIERSGERPDGGPDPVKGQGRPQSPTRRRGPAGGIRYLVHPRQSSAARVDGE